MPYANEADRRQTLIAILVAPHRPVDRARLIRDFNQLGTPALQERVNDIRRDAAAAAQSRLAAATSNAPK